MGANAKQNRLSRAIVRETRELSIQIRRRRGAGGGGTIGFRGTFRKTGTGNLSGATSVKSSFRMAATEADFVPRKATFQGNFRSLA